MKNTLRALALAVGLLAVPSLAAPSELGYGIWVETYKVKFTYVVDTVAQLCFAGTQGSQGPTGLTEVDCSALKRRPEWASIITWVGPK
ncbi:MAG: hypothetical protein QM817_07010 [Archangium sp.]